MPQNLTLEDIRLARDPDHLLTLFRKLGYRVESALAALDPAELDFPPGAGVQRLFLLADHDHLQVLLFELDAVRMANLRLLARDLLLRAGDYLIVATPGDPPYERLAFVNPRRIGQGTQLTVGVRKLVVEPAHPTRHDLDVLEAIAAHGLADAPDALYRAHVRAFDVERMTNRFYRAYANVFHQAADRVRDWNKAHPVLSTPEGSRTFSQRLLSRLMFLYFLQRKGWLAGDRRFLTTWYRHTLRDEGRYWDDLLRPLFFETLNRRRVGDGSPWGDIPYLNGGLFEPVEPDTDPGLYLPNELFDPHDPAGLLGFLNSYNFTVAEDTPLEQEVALDPEMLGKVFENLLEEQERGQSGTFYTPRAIVHYLARSALRHYLADAAGLPSDRLALLFDPEAQHVEADGHPPQTLTSDEAARVERALKDIRALDPAVGSGAFLVGMLHELIAARRACWVVLRQGAGQVPGHTDPPPVAGWKREFIAHNLYGVDIKPEAVEIARLRLWLSLVVDQERDEVEPLPNLDYRLMAGDSLLETLDGEPILSELPTPGSLVQGALPGVPAPAQQLGLGLEESSRARTSLRELKGEYFTAETRDERLRLRQAIEAQERAVVLAALEEKLAQIAARIQWLVDQGKQVNWQGMARKQREMDRLAQRQARLTQLAVDVRRGKPLPFFLYRLHFFEVFRDKGGFDVVLANPPYVRMEHLKEQKVEFKAAYPQVFDGRADLYVYFYARGLELLHEGGTLAYITSNKFMRARYGNGLRHFLSGQTTLETVIDFGDLPVFEATAYPCIVVARKIAPAPGHQVETLTVDDVEVLERLEEEIPQRAWQLPQIGLHPDGWTLERPKVLRLVEKLRAAGRPLGQVVDGRFYMGIKTGLTEAFVIDEATRQRLINEDPRSAELIKPWLRGRDVKRWRVDWAGLYVIFTYHGVDIERYPAIRTYLEPFREKLEARATSKNHAWHELQQPQMGIYRDLERPKIIYPDIGAQCEFAFDDQDHYGSNTIYFIGSGDLHLLGILNATATEFFYRHISASVRGGFLRFFSQYLTQIPIPDPPPAERQAIERLVRRLLALRGQGEEVAALEAELNQRVYRLFGLTKAEIELIEMNLSQVSSR